MSDLDAIHSWEHWREFLFRLGAISSPADLQGFASGLLAGGAALDVEKWLALAEEFMDLPEPVTQMESREALAAYWILAQRSIADSDYGFRLLLPDDAVSMSLRAEALGQWSQSFLAGLGLSECNTDMLDEDGTDMLTTLAEIAQIDIDLEASDENEGLYTELCEFVRIAAMYLYQHNQPSSDAGGSEDVSASLH
ncbi:UPF0149 family protein [Marinagarivorans cellulosilyticus]|uniref:YecA family protein n=1 Tax=Marinagarivorans cellulosilyticus TaxID=2721545 RepID=A0AAN2BLD0_9GAMM|nr:UPF0149 family protein [Marinagarivorans cellulosilyticus]BCD98895.1 hypothetical protein MARGE09_P3096 [Marinagarivorans cellulosilyticus]